jgi:hypothetical protein
MTGTDIGCEIASAADCAMLKPPEAGMDSARFKTKPQLKMSVVKPNRSVKAASS